MTWCPFPPESPAESVSRRGLAQLVGPGAQVDDYVRGHTRGLRSQGCLRTLQRRKRLFEAARGGVAAVRRHVEAHGSGLVTMSRGTYGHESAQQQEP
jgi:hypothetical protein